MTMIWKYKKESEASWGWKRRSSPVLRDPSKCLGFARRLMEFSEKAFRFKMMWIIFNYENAETGLTRGMLKNL